jgi:hypothetical protein
MTTLPLFITPEKLRRHDKRYTGLSVAAEINSAGRAGRIIFHTVVGE